MSVPNIGYTHSASQFLARKMGLIFGHFLIDTWFYQIGTPPDGTSLFNPVWPPLFKSCRNKSPAPARALPSGGAGQGAAAGWDSDLRAAAKEAGPEWEASQAWRPTLFAHTKHGSDHGMFKHRPEAVHIQTLDHRSCKAVGSCT